MPCFGGGEYEDLGPHIRYITARAIEKGTHRRKAEEWAHRQVRRGRRAP